MKILLTIPDNIYLKIIEGKADKRTMMTAISSAETLPERVRLLSESEIITALDRVQQGLDLRYSDWNRYWGVELAKNVVKGCKGVTL